MGLFGKRKKNPDLLSTFDGRCVKYVTVRNLHSDGTVTYDIAGKDGRIAAVGDELRIICGETDVFCCPIAESKYYLLMSGDGVTVEGQNRVSGKYDTVTAYYSYHRK